MGNQNTKHIQDQNIEFLEGEKWILQMYLSAVCQYGFWMLSPMENEYHFIKIQLIIKFNVKEKETVKKGVYKHGKNDNTYKGCNQ